MSQAQSVLVGALRIEIFLELDLDVPFDVLGCRVTEGMSEHIRAEVEIAAHDDLALDRAAGARARLTLAIEGEEPRRFTLILVGGRFVGVAGGALHYRLTLIDPLFPLSLTRNTRKFRDTTTEAIVSTVLREARVDAAWRLTQPLPSRPYCTQYREANLDFILRLLAFDGIHHTLDPEGAVVLADDSRASPRVGGARVHDLVEAAGALHGNALGIHELWRGRRVTTGRITLNDHDWKRPALSLIAAAGTGGDEELEVYDYPAGFREPGEGRRLAELRLQARRAEHSFLEGKGNVVSFAPAHAVVLGGSAGDGFAGEHLIVRVEHVARAPGHGETSYENHFAAIPLGTPFRPAPRPRPEIAGNHTAIVRGPAGSEIHTDAHGRYKAQFHWDREADGSDRDSRWMRMVQEPSTSMFLARTGWEVSVAYVDGDPDRPVGMARNINGQHVPEYSQPVNQNLMAIKTPSSPSTGGYNELKLDDSAGAQGFHLRAELDLIDLVKNDQSETIGRHETQIVGKNLTRQVNKNQVVNIGDDSTTTGNANHIVVVEKDRTVAIGGSETIDVGGPISESTHGDESEKVGVMRLTLSGSVASPAEVARSLIPTPKSVTAGAFAAAQQGAVSAAAGQVLGGLSGGLGGAASAIGQGAMSGAMSSLKGLIPTPESIGSMFLKGGVARTAKKGITRMVGGGFISVAVGEISSSAMLLHTEVIGGVKLTLAGGSIQQSVGKLLSTTVGGAILRSAKGPLDMAATHLRFLVGGPALIAAREDLTVSGDTVKLSAGAKLSLSAGSALSMVLDPAGMTWKGDVKIVADEVKLTGNVVDLTKG